MLVQAPRLGVDLSRREILARRRQELLPLAVALLLTFLGGAVGGDLFGEVRREGEGPEPEAFWCVGDDGAQVVHGISQGDRERELEETVRRRLGRLSAERDEGLGRDEQRHLDGRGSRSRSSSLLGSCLPRCRTRSARRGEGE